MASLPGSPSAPEKFERRYATRRLTPIAIQALKRLPTIGSSRCDQKKGTPLRDFAGSDW
jgi:hypothetical protein